VTRPLSAPRVYSIHIVMKSGKVIDRMLGVGFNANDRQRYYDAYKTYACHRNGWSDSTISDVSMVSERLNSDSGR
jgi:hypothetical protein